MRTCADVRAMCPEAALGLLSGSDRAIVLDHIEQCEPCRELMHELSAVSDELVLLAPNGEPPAGFEQRVLSRVGAGPGEAAPSGRRRWRVLVGASATAVLAVIAIAFSLSRADGGSSSVQEIEMRAASGRVVGEAYLHDNDPTWVFVTVPGWKSDTSRKYWLRVTFADGATTEVSGSGSWGTVLPVDAAGVRELSLIDTDGKVWCSATV